MRKNVKRLLCGLLAAALLIPAAAAAPASGQKAKLSDTGPSSRSSRP